VAEDKGKEEEKFDFTPEGEGYISLDEARILALRAASENPGDYGSQYQGTTMVFAVVESTETDDNYIILLSVRPQGEFSGTPGQEQFFIGKEGSIAFRQVLTSPIRKGGGFPVLPVAIGLVVVGVIAAVGAVLAIGSSSGESVPMAVVVPTAMPAPPTPIFTPTLAPTSNSTPTPIPVYTPPPTPIARVIMVTPTFTPEPAMFVSIWGATGGGDGQFRGPNGVATASDGSVYIVDKGNERIQKLSSDGVFINSWGGFRFSLGNLWAREMFGPWPRAVAAALDGSIYVVDDYYERVQKFTSDGVFVSKWGTEGTGDGEFSSLRGVAVAPDGSVYVSDMGNHRIQKFTSEGDFVSKWGGIGTGDGEFASPRGVAVAPDGSVYVVDNVNHRVQKFTSEGVFISKWDTDRFPEAVAIAYDGSVYVLAKQIKKFTSEGVFISQLGTLGPFDFQYDWPDAIAAAPDGSVYAAVSSTNRIHKFSVAQ